MSFEVTKDGMPLNKLIPLRDIANVVGGYAFKGSDFGNCGIPVVKITNIEPPRVNIQRCERVPSEKLLGLDRFRLAKGDILMAMTGATVGKVGRIRDNQYAYLNQRVAKISSKIGPEFDDFIFALLSQKGFEEKILNNSSGSAQANVSADGIGRVLIPELEPHNQLQVGKFIAAIDDKIDLNRRINKTLEAMAQAIFKSWFIDFDPVKAKIAAKQEGRDPLRAAMCAISGKTDSELDALPPEHYQQLATTAALFPDEMVDSELGEIPRGWVTTPIRDVAELVKGKSYSSKDLVDNDQVALVTLKSFERGGGFRMDGFKPYVGPYKPEQVVLPGDLIVAYTDVTQAAELIGKPAVVVGVDHFKTLVASLDVGIVRPMNERVSRQFLYGLFMTDAFQSHTFAHTSGTTVLHLAKEGVPSYIFPCPDERLVGHFSKAAESMAMEKQKLLDQNRSLATLRDTLLPKLLSGELSVADVTSEVNA